MQINTTKLMLVNDLATPTEKSIGTVVEAMVKKVLVAQDMLLATRLTATSASNPAQVANGTFIYRQAVRNVVGADYDPINGGAVQLSQQGVATMQNNTIINSTHIFEDFDLEILNPETRGPLFADWIASIMVSLQMNLEAVFLRGVYDFNVAMYDATATDEEKTVYVPTTDWRTKMTPELADDEFYDLARFINAKIQRVNKTIVGLNLSDYELWMDPLSHINLTRAYTKVLTNIAAETLATGDLYKNSIMGTNIGTSRYLGKTFDKTKDNKINKDVTFNFADLYGIGITNDDWAMPITVQKFQQIIDPQTGNLRYLVKVEFSLPMSLRKLSFIVLKTAPTAEQITAAQAKLMISTTSTLSNLNETITFQKAEWFAFPSTGGGGGDSVKQSNNSYDYLKQIQENNDLKEELKKEIKAREEKEILLEQYKNKTDIPNAEEKKSVTKDKLGTE